MPMNIGNLQKILGAADAISSQKVASPQPSIANDADFVDYSSVASPIAVSMPGATTAATSGATAAASATAMPTSLPIRPYTKWYRVWERVTLADFYSEMFIVPFIIIVILIHLWGTKTNRRKAKAWSQAHGAIMRKEFARVGTTSIADDADVLTERATNEYVAYATGRENVACLDIKISLLKRYNPMALIAEQTLGFLFESMPAPKERMEATLLAFDGAESGMVPARTGGIAAEKPTPSKSAYDGFVWGVVHKDYMGTLREGRYDLSLTSTKDHAKLPQWATVMSESAEITDAMLTPELVDAVSKAGDNFEALVVSDQPIDAPRKLNDTVPRKRVSLSLRLPSSEAAYADTMPVFASFLRLPDFLVATAHFRPEVMRRVRTTRDEEVRKLRKIDEEAQAEERRAKSDKDKKDKRDAQLKGMTADEQRKFLDKERQVELRRGQKRRTQKA